MRIRELIKRLEEIEQEHGDVEVNIYKTYSKENGSFSEVHFDDDKKDAYIGVYA